MWRPGSSIVAVASDVPLIGLGVPCLDLDRPEAIAAFVLAEIAGRRDAAPCSAPRADHA